MARLVAALSAQEIAVEAAGTKGAIAVEGRETSGDKVPRKPAKGTHMKGDKRRIGTGQKQPA